MANISHLRSKYFTRYSDFTYRKVDFTDAVP